MDADKLSDAEALPFLKETGHVDFVKLQLRQLTWYRLAA